MILITAPPFPGTESGMDEMFHGVIVFKGCLNFQSLHKMKPCIHLEGELLKKTLEPLVKEAMK